MNFAMQTKWLRYPDYKDSGVEWLGDIPKHWEVRRLRNVTNIFKGGTPKRNVDKYFKGDIPWARPVDVTALTSALFIDDTEIHISEEALGDSSARLLPAGIVLLTSRATIGFTAITTVPMATNQGFANFLCKNSLHNVYLAYYLRAIKNMLIALGSGSTFLEVTKSTLKGVEIPLPPLSEQRAIANFLDRKTTEIDALIAKKERLIELLQEKRSALISHVVTKGLDATVEMKDSGVEWLGDIPKHWEMRRLKRLGAFRAGTGFPNSEQGLTNEELPFYKVSDMTIDSNEVFMRQHINSVSIETAKRLRATIFKPGTIIFPKVGVALLTNKRRILTLPACMDNNVMGFTPKVGNNKYLFYLLCLIDLGYLANPGAVPSVNESQIKEIRIVFPPLSEQRAIANFLDQETAELDVLTEKIREAIDKLKEYRTALISAAVTGKIDVTSAM